MKAIKAWYYMIIKLCDYWVCWDKLIIGSTCKNLKNEDVLLSPQLNWFWWTMLSMLWKGTNDLGTVRNAMRFPLKVAVSMMLKSHQNATMVRPACDTGMWLPPTTAQPINDVTIYHLFLSSFTMNGRSLMSRNALGKPPAFRDLAVGTGGRQLAFRLR